MSAWVWDHLPNKTGIDTARGLFSFAGVPLIALAAVLAASSAEKRTEQTLRGGSHLVLAWVLAFLAAIHGLVLAMAVGRLAVLMDALPWVIALFFFGLGPLVVFLEPKSPMGIRTKNTLESEPVWRKTHVVLGVLFALAGAFGVVANLLQLEDPLRLGASVLPGVFALTAAIAYGARLKTP
jgi:hypothetical protein